MSITCEGCGLSYAGGRGPRGMLAQTRRLADPRFIRMLQGRPALPPGRARPARRRVAGPDVGRVPRRAGLLRLLRAPLRHPARRLRLVVRRPRRVVLPGPPPVPVPRPPRHADGDGLADLAHRHRRVGHLRRPARRAPARRAQGEPGDCGDPARRRRRRARTATDDVDDASTASSSPPTPTRPCDLLADATPDEKRDLGAIRYSVNETWLHRDSSVLPKPRQAHGRRGTTGMHACDAPARDVTVSYWMNRLHGLNDADDHVVTLNPRGPRRPESLVTARMTYAHPIFTHEAVAAAARLRERRRRPPRLRRRPPRLGLPRGRLPLRRRGRRVVRGALVTAVLASPAARARRRHREPLAPHAAAAQLHPPPLPVARRRRRSCPDCPGRQGCSRASTPATTSTAGRLGGGIRGDVERFLATARRASSTPRRPGPHARQRPGARAHLRPAVGLLVPAPGRRAAAPSSSRCTTPTASGTPTCSTSTTTGRATVDKAFYVSPFNDVCGEYDVRLRPRRPTRQPSPWASTATASASDRDHHRHARCRPRPARCSRLVATSRSHDPAGEPAHPAARHPAVAAPPARPAPTARHPKEAVR